jgi:outer membrane protein assembly factor BamA
MTAKRILVFFWLFCFQQGYGQKEFSLVLLPCDECSIEEKSILQSIKYRTAFTDTIQRFREVHQVLNQLLGNGYLTATVTGLESVESAQRVYISPGEKFKWATLSRGNVSEGILSLTGIGQKFYTGRDFRPREVTALMNRLLTWCERNGYPFAYCSLADVTIHENKISASLFLEPGTRFTIDSILVKGNAKLSNTYLQNYLAIRKGIIYNEQNISRISTRIKELPMVSEVRPYQVAFNDSTATLFLYLQNQKASKLDGIIGVLPDNNQPGKVNVTGDVSIRLLSAFGYGELIDFNWKLPESKTQDLKTRFNYPFLFQTPFGIDLGLNIYKKDTTYIELNRLAGLQYSLTGGSYIKAFYENRKSTLLNTKIYESVTVLPPFADISSQHYGLSYKIMNLDYRLNPRRGYAAEITASAGTKKITPNAKLKQVDYSSLQLKSTQYLIRADGDVYFPIGNKLVNNTGVISGLLIGEETFQNELYRLGGLKSLRGFDEESILASKYIILKNEWRYILEENSYLLLFINAAWYERKQRDYFITDKPLGFGAGITFETKLGIFSLNYALGKEFDNPIRFRAAKVHFGLVNYF